jgi:hypothetical protein
MLIKNNNWWWLVKQTDPSKKLTNGGDKLLHDYDRSISIGPEFCFKNKSIGPDKSTMPFFFSLEKIILVESTTFFWKEESIP